MAEVSALAAVLQPLPLVDKFKASFNKARDAKSRSEWTKTSRQIRRHLKARGLQLSKLEDDAGQKVHIQNAYDRCFNVAVLGHGNWRTVRLPDHQNSVKREADAFLFNLLADTVQDQHLISRLNTIEDNAPNWGIASFVFLEDTFGGTEIEDTMPMLLDIVETDIAAGLSVADFVQSFSTQQAEIVAAYTTRDANGTPTLDRARLLDHLWGVVAYARLPDGVRRSLRSQMLAWNSANFNMQAVFDAATKDAKLNNLEPRELASIWEC